MYRMQLYAQYDARGTLPFDGSWEDQPAWFASLCLILDGQKAHWEQVRHELHEAAMKK